MASPERARTRNRALLAIIAPLFVFAALVVTRRDVVLKPYELGWCIWVFAILITGVGIGYGLARYRR